MNSYIDFHSHILPHIDDGARDLEESVAMARTAAVEGIGKVVCTPHAYKDYGELVARAVEQRKLLQERLGKEDIRIQLIQGYEVYASEHLLDYEDVRALTLAGSDYLLLELDFGHLPECLDEIIYLLQISEVIPILAHPERYGYLDIKALEQFRQRGFLLQVNTSSITGLHGAKVQKTAKKLVKKKMVDVIGTDAHSVQARGPYMKEALVLMGKLGFPVDDYNPEYILEGSK